MTNSVGGLTVGIKAKIKSFFNYFNIKRILDQLEENKEENREKRFQEEYEQYLRGLCVKYECKGWYGEPGYLTKEEAKKLEEQEPSVDGWFVNVTVLPDGQKYYCQRD